MGSDVSKEILGASLLGINTKTVKDVFKTNTAKTPCVYLFLIGKAKDLFEGEYRDDDLICKYGCSDDLARRTSEHESKFFKEFKVNIELICFSIIESQYIFNAEKSIRNFFKTYSFECSNGYKEFVLINKKMLGQTKQHYTMIQNSYIGRFQEMNEKIIKLEKEILVLQHNIEIKDNLIALKEKDIALKDKDLEIEKLKNETMAYKLKLIESSK